jgi:hypothetical protein
MSGILGDIRKLSILCLFAILPTLLAGQLARADEVEEVPAAPDEAVPVVKPKPRRPRDRAVPELQDDTADKVNQDAADFFPQLTAPIPGLDDGKLAVGPAPAPPARWLDVNYQFLDESDPYPPGQDPFREWPEVALGWFAGVDLNVTLPRVHSELNSANLGPGNPISGTFANPFQLPVADFNWTVMPRIFAGYRLENGYGEVLVSYRFVQSEGSGAVMGFDAAGNGQLNSRITANVLDLDYGFTDPVYGLPWYLPQLVRRTMGVRVASAVFDTAVAGQQILQEKAGNVFVGAGPRVNFEGTWPTGIPQLAVIGGADVSGVIGVNYQRYAEQAIVGGAVRSASARTAGDTTGIPILRVQAGLTWTPGCGDQNVRFSAGYQWERWWFINETDSIPDLTFMGPYVRGEYRW